MSSNDQATNKQDPQNDLYDSGVTNGDVDWLFRGKSKKLTKKMNFNKDIDGKERQRSLDIDRDKEKSPESAKSPPEVKEKSGPETLDKLGDKNEQVSGTKQVSPESKPKTPAKEKTVVSKDFQRELNKEKQKLKEMEHDKENPSTTKLTDPRRTSDAEEANIRPENSRRESSKLDKLFRTRSSSVSKTDKKDEKEGKKNFNFINYAGTSFDGASLYNQNFETNYLDSSAKPRQPGQNPIVKAPKINKSPATSATSQMNTNCNVSSSNPLSTSNSNTSNTSNNSNNSSSGAGSNLSAHGSPAESATTSTSSSATKPRSRSSSTGSTSGKDGGGKKSIFSSLSSKFKSQPSTATSTNHSTANNNSSSDHHEKLTADVIAVGGGFNPQFKEREDLSALYNKPPAEIGGMPIKRRNSAQTQEQPQNSLEKLSSSANSFNSLFKRRSSTSSTASQQSTQSPHQPVAHNSRIVLNKKPNKEKNPIKELNDVNLKRVNFSIDKLVFDPQQQIPSRRPKKGNVLIPEDLMAPPPRLSQGISLNDGATKVNDEPKYSEKELNLAIEAQRRALLEAEKHAQEAHNSAKRIAAEVQQYKAKARRNTTITEGNEEMFDNEEDRDNYRAEQEREQHDQDQTFDELKNIEIDKPLHYHEKYFEDDTMELDISNLSLEQIYTRCCHLREILPIPATLKQLKNKTKPLSVLKLLNPKPTLIDVLSFSDFIAIVPITTVIFDNVTMTTEMLKHILSSLTYNKSLEKLSLRNVPIDEIGWKYLCKFLSSNRSIKKLDISQQRIKSDTKPFLIRGSMNWKLFIKALIVRGGIDELVINGCKLSDQVFKDLVDNALTISTFRLGIASCELNDFKTETICNWIKHPKSRCVGVDVAFNDLSQGQLKYFIDCFNSGNVKLIFFSLYQTNLSNFEEAGKLLESLTKVKTLRFLDLSSLPDLFPGIISKLNFFLPKFENLKRIHFDLNNLTSPSIIAISEILPKVKGLLHVSFLGNRNLNNSVAASIYAAVKKSDSIYTLDLDYDLINDKVNQKIAFYLMRNMDNVINLNNKKDSNKKDHKTDDNIENATNNDHEEEELMFDGSLLMEAAEKLLVENDNSPNKKEDIKLQKIISNALIERTRELRDGIHRTIDTLFDKKNAGTLSLEGKESLLRFCLLDASLEKLVHMFEEQAKRAKAISMSPSASGEFHDATDSIQTSSVNHNGDNDDNSDKQRAPSSGSDITKSITNSSGKSQIFGDSENRNNNHHLTINVNDKELLHQSSNELITSGGPIISPRNTETLNKLGYFQASNESSTFQPHQVVVDSKPDGQNVPIDNLTGRPVLMRSISQTSSHAKEQELEEGEFHRWGFFMQQRNNSNSDLKNASANDSKEAKDRRDSEDEQPKTLPALNVLPSGNELRDAIIEAKGIESITDLIDKINNNRVSLEKIYHISDRKQQDEILQSFENFKINEEAKKQCNDCQKSKISSELPPTSKQSPEELKKINGENMDNSPHVNDDDESIDSIELEQDKECDHVDAVVDQVYDKLLNDAQRVRSNK